jgi:hypothetical protein
MQSIPTSSHRHSRDRCLREFAELYGLLLGRSPRMLPASARQYCAPAAQLHISSRPKLSIILRKGSKCVRWDFDADLPRTQDTSVRLAKAALLSLIVGRIPIR